MRFTWRLAALFAFGTLIFLLSGVSEWFAVAGAVFDGVLVALVLADLLITAGPAESWEVARLVEDRISLGAPNRVVVTARWVADRHGLPRKLIVRDEPPVDFEVQGSSSQTLVFGSAAREQRFGNYVKPPAKGDFEFGNISVQYDGALGLVAKSHTLKRLTGKVFPNLHETEKFEILARKGLLRRLGSRICVCAAAAVSLRASANMLQAMSTAGLTGQRQPVATN